MVVLTAARPPALDPVPDRERRDRDIARALSRSADRPMVRAGSARRVRGRSSVLLVAAAAGLAVVLWADRGVPHPVTNAPLTASSVLLTAANEVEAFPPPSGRYWVLRLKTSKVVQVHSAGLEYQVRDVHRTQTWIAAEAAGTSWSLEQALGAAPATPDSLALWKRAGSPRSWQGPAGEWKLSADPGKISRSALPTDAKKFVLTPGRYLSLEGLRALPTDSNELRRLLLQGFVGRVPDGSPDENFLIFTEGVRLLSLPVSTQVRAAVYRMLAGLPGIKSLGTVQDTSGRAGRGVVLPGKVVDTRLIVDAKTGLPLDVETVVARGGSPKEAPGTILSDTLVEGISWTDDEPPVE